MPPPVLGPSDTGEDQTNKKHKYDTNICQLVQARINTLGVLTRAYIQSMIVHEIIHYQDSNLFSVVRKKVDSAVADAFVISPLCKAKNSCRAQYLCL